MDDFIVHRSAEERIAAAHAGAELCRAAIADGLAAHRTAAIAEVLSPADAIVQRAKARAAAERRGRAA